MKKLLEFVNWNKGDRLLGLSARRRERMGKIRVLHELLVSF